MIDKYNTSFLLLSIFILGFNSCNVEPAVKNETNFIIPDSFKITKYDKEADEILAVKYKDEMLIIVSENMSKMIKKGPMFGSALMKLNFEAKFPVLVNKIDGFNLSEQDHYFVNRHLYMRRSFNYDLDDSKAYYEYGALYIKDPEEYYEFFITGNRSLRESHQPLIKSFLKGVR